MFPRTTGGNFYTIYKRDITAANQAGDQPVVGGDNAREIGMLIEVPAGETVTVVKTTVLQLHGRIYSNTAETAPVILTDDHGLVTGDSVTIEGANCPDDINGTHVVTVIDVNKFSIPVPVTSRPGNDGIWTGPRKTFSSVPLVGITANREVISDHSGGQFKIEVTSKSGVAPMDIYYKPL